MGLASVWSAMGIRFQDGPHHNQASSLAGMLTTEMRWDQQGLPRAGREKKEQEEKSLTVKAGVYGSHLQLLGAN